MPAISVIIPTYNHAGLIGRTLASVFAQTLAADEVIVVNDGSPDDTAGVLRPYADAGRIRYVEQANAGQAAARNRGLAEASGEFVAFLDDDDLWPADKLQWQVEVLSADPACIAVAGSAQVVYAAGEPGEMMSVPVGPVDRRHLYGGNPFVSPGQVLIRRSALTTAGGFAVDIWGADDYDLWFRLAGVGRIESAARLGLYYRRHATNASRDSGRMLHEVERVVRRHLSVEDLAARPALRRDAYRFLYRYGGGALVSEIRGHMRRLQFASAARKLWGLRPLAGTICRDPLVAWWFVTAWVPRLTRRPV